MTKSTAVIADDHALIRQGIRQMWTSAGVEVVAEAADGLEAIAMVRKHQPTLLSLDIAMPYARGIEVFGELRRWSPETRTVVFSGMTSSALIGELASAGADAIFLKNTDLDAFVQSIPQVLAGKQVFGPGVVELVEAFQSSVELTARERQVLSLVVQGLSNRDVANRLGVSVKTVDHHRSNLMRKVDVHSATELMVYAMREGLLDTNLET